MRSLDGYRLTRNSGYGVKVINWMGSLYKGGSKYTGIITHGRGKLWIESLLNGDNN